MLKITQYETILAHLNMSSKELEKVEDLDYNQILELKNELKNLDLKIKEKIKLKTISITENTHNKIKEYCTGLNKNIGDWSEEILLKEVGTVKKCSYYNDMEYNFICKETINTVNASKQSFNFIKDKEYNFKYYNSGSKYWEHRIINYGSIPLPFDFIDKYFTP